MPLFDDDFPDWKPFSRFAGIAWLVFYLVFLLYAAADRAGFLIIESSLWFFENFLYIGTYMADACTSALPLVASEESNWTILFTQWGLLRKDLQIGATTRALGWLGRLATAAWLAWREAKARD